MLTPEQQIRANVQAALGKQQTKQPVKKHNIFVDGVLKSASALRTKNTDLVEIEEACSQLPVSNATCAAYTLICAHNNTQLREKALERGLEDPGIISAAEMSLATGEAFMPADFVITTLELQGAGVLWVDDEGFYRVALYAE